MKSANSRLLSSSKTEKETRSRQEITFDISVYAVNFPRKTAFDSVKKGCFLCIMSYFRKKYSVEENMRFLLTNLLK